MKILGVIVLLLVAAWGWLFLSNQGVLVSSKVVTEDRVGKFTESLGIQGPIPADLRAGLSELITALEVRVGEEIDAGSDESAYDLGRSIEIINRWRRRSGDVTGTK